MKKLAVLLCALTLISSAAIAEETTGVNVKGVNVKGVNVKGTNPVVNTTEQKFKEASAPVVNEGIKNPDSVKARPSKEEMIKIKKAREAAFEQKLGLTDEQKAKAKELRIKGHEKMKPVMEQLISKKKEAEMVRRSRIASWAQEEKLAVIDKEIQDLEKQAKSIRKQNMKDFESILTRDQKKILKQMKKEGRRRFEERRKLCPPPCPAQPAEKNSVQ